MENLILTESGSILVTLENNVSDVCNLILPLSTVKSEEELKTINEQIFVLVYSDNSVSIGSGNKIKDATIASTVN